MDEQATAEAEAAAIEYGRWLFAQDCRFLAAAAAPEQVPDLSGRPEVAFAGRSNVGKSSLVNALTGRRTLARTSHTPGRTQQINFFDLGGRLVLVDLPGYGYARASKQAVKRWTALARAYLRGRPSLRRVCLLIDARRGPRASDLEVMAELDAAAVSYQAVLTKADKLAPDALAAVAREVEALRPAHVALHPEVIATSAHAGTGIAALRAGLGALAGAGASG
jgi:GTP-binding protein